MRTNKKSTGRIGNKFPKINSSSNNNKCGLPFLFSFLDRITGIKWIFFLGDELRHRSFKKAGKGETPKMEGQGEKKYFFYFSREKAAIFRRK